MVATAIYSNMAATRKTEKYSTLSLAYSFELEIRWPSYYYFIPQVVKIPGIKNKKKLKSKCRMVIGQAGQLTECRAKAQS